MDGGAGRSAAAEQGTGAGGQAREGTSLRRPRRWRGAGRRRSQSALSMEDQGQGRPRGLEGQTPFPQPGNKQRPGHKTPREFDFFEKRQGQRGAALPFKTLMWREDLNWGSPACGNRVRTYREKPCPNADGIVSAAVMPGWAGPGGTILHPRHTAHGHRRGHREVQCTDEATRRRSCSPATKEPQINTTRHHLSQPTPQKT